MLGGQMSHMLISLWLKRTDEVIMAIKITSKPMRKVKHWSNNNQKQRWVATALLQSEKKFRKVRGHKSMSVLVSALEQYTKQKGVDNMQKVA